MGSYNSALSHWLSHGTHFLTLMQHHGSWWIAAPLICTNCCELDLVRKEPTRLKQTWFKFWKFQWKAVLCRYSWIATNFETLFCPAEIWGAVKTYYICLTCFWRVVVFWGRHIVLQGFAVSGTILNFHHAEASKIHARQCRAACHQMFVAMLANSTWLQEDARSLI